MHTALHAASRTLRRTLEAAVLADPGLAAHFAGAMEVSLHTPSEMIDRGTQGLSVWLYRVVRDEQRLNTPPQRVAPDRVRPTPLPVRLHYLVTPIVDSTASVDGPELEQVLLGRVLQRLHDQPCLRGADLEGDLAGTDHELHCRLEPLGLEELTRVWDALDRAYQLSVSYELTVVEIDSAREPRSRVPVREVSAPHGVLVGGGP